MSHKAQRRPELPSQLTAEVAIDGRALPGAFIAVDLPMYAKNTYRLMFGPTDGSGRIEIDRVALEREIRATLSTGLMDYAPFTEWRGEIVVSPFDTYDIARALDGYRTWGRISGGLYPVNFIAKMEALRDRLEKNPDASLTVNVHVDPQDGASVTTRAKRAVAPPDIANPS